MKNQPFTDISKQSWIDIYSGKILRMWGRWESPLGIDEDYLSQLKNELSEYFDDPLKRALIESSY